ncbi:hypothetical protein JG688_00018312 [Phytophthora aleatoria]|uniref:Uncharacterized protein n=1 Tax=Phytophthora aleatoria TaxID=2496075 RepID=A0A8J5IB44_9STRA|nr:hypothetical protein JG688_00018312 [Phytophthora aleatoria]
MREDTFNPVGQQLLDGNDHGADIKEMIRGEKVNSRWTTQEWWGKNRMPAPTEMEPIHVHSTSCWRKRTWRIPSVHLKLYCRPTFHKQFESYGLDSRPSGDGKVNHYHGIRINP